MGERGVQPVDCHVATLLAMTVVFCEPLPRLRPHPVFASAAKQSPAGPSAAPNPWIAASLRSSQRRMGERSSQRRWCVCAPLPRLRPHPVFASAAKQSPADPAPRPTRGLPRRCAPRNDGGVLRATTPPAPPTRLCERSEAISCRPQRSAQPVDCRVATLLAMTYEGARCPASGLPRRCAPRNDVWGSAPRYDVLGRERRRWGVNVYSGAANFFC